MNPPTLADLTARFLAAKAIAPDHDELSEVMPHEVITSFRADAATTWVDAKSAFHLFGVTLSSLPMPSDWSSFVSQLSDIPVMPLCLGAVPQRMRELTTIRDFSTQNRLTETPTPSKALQQWIDGRVKAGTSADLLIAASMCRLTGDADRAEQLLNQVSPENDGIAQVLNNEKAALAWNSGDVETAAKIWNEMPENPVTLFNRGICEWSLGRTGMAATLFDRAADAIPDRSGWSHLAAFYASICEGE